MEMSSPLYVLCLDFFWKDGVTCSDHLDEFWNTFPVDYDEGDSGRIFKVYEYVVCVDSTVAEVLNDEPAVLIEANLSDHTSF